MEPSEYDTLAAVEETHWWYTGMAGISRRLIEGWVSEPSPILDAGCGTGGALRWLTQYGRAHGCELSPLALRHARRKAPTPPAQADVQNLPYASNTFGLVTCFDVLYHLYVSHDGQALEEFFRVLRPGGWLCLRVPANGWIRREHDRRVHTRHRYGRAELATKLRLAGFDPPRLARAGSMVLLAAVLTSLVERIRFAQIPRDSEGALAMPHPLVNRVLRQVLAAEVGLAVRGVLPFGLSLYALARKPPASPV